MELRWKEIKSKNQCKECDRQGNKYREYFKTFKYNSDISSVIIKVRNETSSIILLFVHNYFYLYIYIKWGVSNLILIY